MNFANNQALLSITQQQMQEKTNLAVGNSACLDLNIQYGKSKVLKVNTTNITPIMLEGEH